MMKQILSPWRVALAALAIGVAAICIAPAVAQQPTSVNPTASSVNEEQLLKALKPGETIHGRITIPDQKAANLIQPEGPAWRDFHRDRLPWIGGVAILGMLALLAIFYAARGRIMLESGEAGRKILRFGAIERFIHWTTATSFIILALSGLNVSFGRTLLLPIMGESAFGSMSAVLKPAHNYVAFPFMAGVLCMFVIWVGGNIPKRVDWTWLRQGGGMIGHAHPPAGRFNAGQKAVFWIVIVGGASLAVSGVNMLFPYLAANGVIGLQFWTTVHAVIAMLMIAIICAHIYIGTIGMEGAFEAMGSGEVDLNWAREHHSLWVADEMAREKATLTARMQPAE